MELGGFFALNSLDAPLGPMGAVAPTETPRLMSLSPCYVGAVAIARTTGDKNVEILKRFGGV